MENNEIIFHSKNMKNVCISNDLKNSIIKNDVNIIEQRIITSILTCIKEVQSKFIDNKLINGKSNVELVNIGDYVDGYANQGEINFVIDLKDLNSLVRMRTETIKIALVNLSNLSWFTLKDDTVKGLLFVPFLQKPQVNSKNIFFVMDIAVFKKLAEINRYYYIHTSFAFEVSSKNSLKFLLWVIDREKLNIFRKTYKQLLSELNISVNKYENPSKFERDFLAPIKNDLENYSDFCFNYVKIKNVFEFEIYRKKKMQIHNLNNPVNKEKIIRYIINKRKLSENDLKTLNIIYNIHGFTYVNKIIKRKIPIEYIGEEFLNQVFLLIENSGK